MPTVFRVRCLILLFLAMSALRAQTVLPPGGSAMLPTGAGLDALALQAAPANRDAATLEAVDAGGPGFARALRITTLRDLSPAWAVELKAPLAPAARAGDVALLRFFARAIRSADETSEGYFRVVVQQDSPPFAKSLETTHTVSSEWREFLAPFEFDRDFEPGAAEVAFGFGFKRQQLEIAGVELICYGRSIALADLPRSRLTYAGREPDAPWRRDALARIEQVRKSDFAIEIRDADGRPLPQARVALRQTRSAFLFGTAVDLSCLVEDTPDHRIYRAKLLELFNAAGPENHLKWQPWIGDWGPRFDREVTLAGLHWLQAQRLPTRGHVLVWPGWNNLPNSLRELADSGRRDEIPARVLAHIADITAATREYLHEWDVLNEPYDNHALMDLFGRDIMADWFHAARRGAPQARLYLNDYGNHDLYADRAHVDHFADTVRFLLEKGAPLQGLGLQGHIGNRPNSLHAVRETLVLYARFGLPIHITEFDISTDDEELQADYTRDFLILCYSHPSVIGVQHWGFWEARHWRPQAALFRRDWSEKPSARAYRDLVLHQWRTRLEGDTDPAGRLAGRGFHGDYEVIVTHAGREIRHVFRLGPDEKSALVPITLR